MRSWSHRTWVHCYNWNRSLPQCSSFCCYCDKTLTENNLGVLFHLIGHSPSWSPSSTWRWEWRHQTVEEICLLACCPWLARLSSDKTQDHLPKCSTTHRRLGALTLTINQEYAPQTCLQASMMEASPQVRVFLPRWVKFVSSWQNLSSSGHFILQAITSFNLGDYYY